VSYPVAGRAVEGLLYREAQSCLGPAFAQSFYLFFLSGTSTPANVYTNGTLTTPFSPGGRVVADNFGRFPPIYLDPSIIYRVQFFDRTNTQRWQSDPYTSQLSTLGTSSLSAFGVHVASTGELTVPAPNTGGTGVSLTLQSGALGSAPLQISSTLPGNSALIINSSATTGAQTATFVATNKPGTATSSPAGWLPITCDGVQYYTPIWHGNNFTPYVSNPTALGEVIVASSVNFGGTGLTTATGGTATPGNWFTPVFTGVGAGFWINITKTGGLSGLAFSAAQGAWTNIGAGGLTISSNAQATISGTYQLSTSVTGSPVVASGTISLSNNNGIQSPTYNGATPLILAGDGTASLNGVSDANWFAPTTTNVGSGFWINITQTGGTTGSTFNNALGAWTNITNGGITIGISGPGGSTFNVTGTYIIASDSGGVNQLGSGTITLSGGTNVQSPNWSGTTPLVLAGNGAATLNGVGTSSWYSPNTANVGSGFWINITRTGSSPAGVNFSAAQGSWTNITNSGLTIDMSGFTGDVGTVTVTGTYQVSSSSSGTPVLGSGSISLSVSGLTVVHVYTAAGAGTETTLAGTSNVVIEGWAGTGNGGNGSGTGCAGVGGGGGSSGSYFRSFYASSSGLTLAYVVGAQGAVSTVSSGTLAVTAMSAPAGLNGGNGPTSAGGAQPAIATGGNVTNVRGNAGTAGGVGSSGLGGAPVTGVNATGTSGGRGSFVGAGRLGIPGSPGVIAFLYS
jgi:hypothetical protein